MTQERPPTGRLTAVADSGLCLLILIALSALVWPGWARPHIRPAAQGALRQCLSSLEQAELDELAGSLETDLQLLAATVERRQELQAGIDALQEASAAWRERLLRIHDHERHLRHALAATGDDVEIAGRYYRRPDLQDRQHAVRDRAAVLEWQLVESEAALAELTDGLDRLDHRILALTTSLRAREADLALRRHTHAGRLSREELGDRVRHLESAFGVR